MCVRKRVGKTEFGRDEEKTPIKAVRDVID